jgi:hypothetical protein
MKTIRIGERLNDWLLYSFWPCRALAALAMAALAVTAPIWHLYGQLTGSVYLLIGTLMLVAANTMQHTVRVARLIRRQARYRLRAQMLLNPSGNVRLLNALLTDRARQAAQ